MINFIFLWGKVLLVEKLGSERKEGTYLRDIADIFIFALTITTKVTEYI